MQTLLMSVLIIGLADQSLEAAGHRYSLPSLDHRPGPAPPTYRRQLSSTTPPTGGRGPDRSGRGQQYLSAGLLRARPEPIYLLPKAQALAGTPSPLNLIPGPI